jgi:acetylserotonin N-methyltransferase
MFAAVSLGVFDGERPAGVALGRLLDACVALGLLEKRGSDYVNTPVADAYLRTASTNSLVGYVRYSNDVLYRLWSHLEAAVTEGTPRWGDAFGSRGETVRRTTYGSEDFCRGMHGLGVLSSAAIVDAFDLSRFTHLVDLGGGTGHLAAAVKARHPAMRVTLLDYGHVLATVKPYLAAGVETIAADFCAEELPGADLFALGRILHHRSEERGRALLARIYDCLPAGGAVLLVERFLEDVRPEGHMSSLNMLVCTDCGEERAADEYESMLREAGFTRIGRHVTGSTLDAMLARK